MNYKKERSNKAYYVKQREQVKWRSRDFKNVFENPETIPTQGSNTDLITNIYIDRIFCSWIPCTTGDHKHIIHDATFQVHKDCHIAEYVLDKTATGTYGYGVYNSCTMQASEYNQMHE